MKNIKLLIVLSLILGFVSCKKEEIPTPSNPQSQVYAPENVSITNTNWVLYSGRVFVKNLDNNSTFYYDHFGPNKNSSNLDIFSASSLPIDILSKGMTTWKITYSQLILDGGSYYSLNGDLESTFNVYGLENGSQRSIELLNSTSDYMNVKLYESNGNDGTYNYSFYNILTFVKAGSSVTPTLPDVPYGYTYNGVVNGSNTVTTLLTNTKWVVTKSVQNFVTTVPNDTLEFISKTLYTINGSTARNYNLSSIVGSNMKSLSLYSFTTLGGDWSGQVQGTFIDDRVINNSNFSNILTTTPDARLWMVRIQ